MASISNVNHYVKIANVLQIYPRWDWVWGKIKQKAQQQNPIAESNGCLWREITAFSLGRMNLWRNYIQKLIRYVHRDHGPQRIRLCPRTYFLFQQGTTAHLFAVPVGHATMTDCLWLGQGIQVHAESLQVRFWIVLARFQLLSRS